MCGVFPEPFIYIYSEQKQIDEEREIIRFIQLTSISKIYGSKQWLLVFLCGNKSEDPHF